MGVVCREGGRRNGEKICGTSRSRGRQLGRVEEVRKKPSNADTSILLLTTFSSLGLGSLLIVSAALVDSLGRYRRVWDDFVEEPIAVVVAPLGGGWWV